MANSLKTLVFSLFALGLSQAAAYAEDGFTPTPIPLENVVIPANVPIPNFFSDMTRQPENNLPETKLPNFTLPESFTPLQIKPPVSPAQNEGAENSQPIQQYTIPQVSKTLANNNEVMLSNFAAPKSECRNTNPKLVPNKTEVKDQKINALISNSKLNLDGNRAYYYIDKNSSEKFNGAIASALTEYKNSTGITFVKTADKCQSNMSFYEVNSNDKLDGSGTTLAEQNAGGLTMKSAFDPKIFIKKHAAYDKGSYGYSTILHEIGHAVGLEHPRKYQLSEKLTDRPELNEIEDNDYTTIMSYHKQSPFSRYQSDLGYLDRLALKEIYKN